MDVYKIQIIETLVVIASYAIVFYITKTMVNNSLKHTHLQRGRRKMIIKVLNLIWFLTTIIILSAIWGLNQSEIAVFVGTILTALGIAFFAQWSLLSNITSSLLLFFNHPLKIGDTLKVLDKDYPFEGEITDLTYFFVHLRTKEGEIITIPNSQILQKSISILQNPDAKKG
jgi:small-conductance mechanosensitive channel